MVKHNDPDDSASEGPLPAHLTKHLSVLQYCFAPSQSRFVLQQRDDGQSNGTALWLGGQCLSLYLVDIARKAVALREKTATLSISMEKGSGRVLSNPQPARTFKFSRPKAIELGSGVGLTALALSSMGWDVLATDTSDVIGNVLSRNLQAKHSSDSSKFGTVQVRELDWTVPPSLWCWSNPEIVASHSISLGLQDGNSSKTIGQEQLLQPPFDMIVTSDTIYTPSLIKPLLRTIHHLSHYSSPPESSEAKHPIRYPPVYLALENRDSAVVDSFFAQARDEWHFACTKVPERKLSKLMESGGISWDRDQWVGVEVWKLTTSVSSS